MQSGQPTLVAPLLCPSVNPRLHSAGQSDTIFLVVIGSLSINRGLNSGRRCRFAQQCHGIPRKLSRSATIANAHFQGRCRHEHAKESPALRLVP